MGRLRKFPAINFKTNMTKRMLNRNNLSPLVSWFDAFRKLSRVFVVKGLGKVDPGMIMKWGRAENWNSLWEAFVHYPLKWRMGNFTARHMQIFSSSFRLLRIFHVSELRTEIFEKNPATKTFRTLFVVFRREICSITTIEGEDGAQNNKHSHLREALDINRRRRNLSDFIFITSNLCVQRKQEIHETNQLRLELEEHLLNWKRREFAS